MSRTLQRKNRFVPRVELLEDRWAPADLAMPTITAVGTDWQTYGHDDMRTGASSVVALITTPTIAWVAGTPFSGAGSPVTGSGVVVAPGIPGAATNELSDATGAEVAAFGTTSYVSQNAVTLNPVIDGSGNMYITNNSTSLMKVAPSGATVWTTVRPNFSAGGNDEITTDPFVDNSVGGLPPPYVYFGASSPDGSHGMIYAAADANGALALNAPVIGRPIAISSDSLGLTLYVRTTAQIVDEVAVESSFIYAFNAATLAQTWVHSAGGPFVTDGYGAITVNPTGTPAGALYYMTFNGNLVQADPSNGNPLLSVSVGNEPYSSINLNSTAGIVYVSGGSFIHAYNATTLAPIWSFATPANALFTAPALAVTGTGSALYFVTTTGTLYSVDGATGAENWDVDLQTLLGAPAGARLDSATIIDSFGNIIYNDLNYGAVAITGGALPPPPPPPAPPSGP